MVILMRRLSISIMAMMIMFFYEDIYGDDPGQTDNCQVVEVAPTYNLVCNTGGKPRCVLFFLNFPAPYIFEIIASFNVLVLYIYKVIILLDCQVLYIC